ncbi:TPA: hypothetical protein ACJX73_006385, partial [Pseudomonas aeruginosa]
DGCFGPKHFAKARHHHSRGTQTMFLSMAPFFLVVLVLSALFTDAWNDRELRLLLMLTVFGYSVTVLTITVEMYRFEMAEKAMWGASCNKANYMNCQPDYQR